MVSGSVTPYRMFFIMSVYRDMEDMPTLSGIAAKDPAESETRCNFLLEQGI
jgi:hypothetical protein